jgi:hypothetical protein
LSFFNNRTKLATHQKTKKEEGRKKTIVHVISSFLSVRLFFFFSFVVVVFVFFSSSNLNDDLFTVSSLPSSSCFPFFFVDWPGPLNWSHLFKAVSYWIEVNWIYSCNQTFAELFHNSIISWIHSINSSIQFIGLFVIFQISYFSCYFLHLRLFITSIHTLCYVFFRMILYLAVLDKIFCYFLPHDVLLYMTCYFAT